MKVLVTGATGNVGRLVVDQLLGTGVEVRALTNNPGKAALPAGVMFMKPLPQPPMQGFGRFA